MENNKNLMMGLLAVGLCLGLLWGVSPSMAASSFQTENQKKKTNTLRSFKTPAMQRYMPAKKSNMVAPKLNKSLMPNSKATTKNPLILNPGYDQKRLSDNMTKGYHSGAGTGQAKINIGKPVKLNPKLTPSAETQQKQINIGKPVKLNPKLSPSAETQQKQINIGKPVKLNPKLSPSAEAQQNVQTAGTQQKTPSAEAQQKAPAQAGQDAWNKGGGHSGDIKDIQKRLKQAAEAAAAKKEAQLHAQPQAELQPTKGPDPDAFTNYGGSVVPPGGIGGYSLSKPIGQTPSAQPAGPQQKAASAEAQQNVQTAGTQQKAPSAEAQQKAPAQAGQDAWNKGGGHSGDIKDIQKRLKQAAEAAAAQKKAAAQQGSGGIRLPQPMGVDPANFGGVAGGKAADQQGSGGWGAGYGKAASDPNFGGYGGSGVVPPGPDRVPGSTPPPSAQSKKSGPNVADKAIGVLDVCKSKPWDAVGCFQKGISELGDSLNPF